LLTNVETVNINARVSLDTGKQAEEIRAVYFISSHVVEELTDQLFIVLN